MDIIYLHDLTIDTVIGVWEWERRIRQPLILNIELGVDAARAGASDSIDDTVDYQAVTDRIIAFATASQFRLIEALAEHIAQLVLAEFSIKWIRVQVNKQGVVRHVRDVGVIVERGARD